MNAQRTAQSLNPANSIRRTGTHFQHETTAAEASLLDCTTLPIQSFMDRSAAVIIVKMNTRLTRPLTRSENFLIRWSACSTALATASAAVAGL